MHILFVPGLILALLTAHPDHGLVPEAPSSPGRGRTNENVVGYRPCRSTAKAGGFFFVVFGVITLDLRTGHDQPDLAVRALHARPGHSRVAARLVHRLARRCLAHDAQRRVGDLPGYTISWNILVPAVIIPGIVFTLMGLYPWIEQWATGDKSEHHLLDRPRNAPCGPLWVRWRCCSHIPLWDRWRQRPDRQFLRPVDQMPSRGSCALRYSWCHHWCSSPPNASVLVCSVATATSCPWHGDRQHPAASAR